MTKIPYLTLILFLMAGCKKPEHHGLSDYQISVVTKRCLDAGLGIYTTYDDEGNIVQIECGQRP